ncbi:MAG: hypothetical protein L6Q71_11570 [Planctomycetes bacterium]|nr:hypothetical protein [Planctomycetota bacterium]NUQ35151.1 hypothetical protein [Planctomycetaceae bacterium]
MTKLMKMFAVCIAALGIAVPAIYAQDETKPEEKEVGEKKEGDDKKESEKPKSVRYAAVVTGVTADNKEEVIKAGKALDGVKNCEVAKDFTKIMFVMNEGKTLTEEAVKAALEAVTGVTLTSFKEMTAPAAGAAKPRDKKKKEGREEPAKEEKKDGAGSEKKDDGAGNSDDEMK